MPRVFSAIELPALAAAQLALIRSEVSAARWVAAENMHITLRFFGDVDDALADEIAARLAEVEAPPLTIAVAGTATFGGASETVLYAAVAETPELAALQRTHERIARAVGLGAPEHGFRPHVTLARARHPRASQIARFLAETATLKIPPFTANEFVLLSSRPGRGGGPYALELAVPLN
jgi:RNA 2',3'-cyclic 3'-phosphodiesterase